MKIYPGEPPLPGKPGTSAAALSSKVPLPAESPVSGTVRLSPAPDPRLSITGDPLSNLIHSLKLPQDSLSRSIVSFVRFFSLPLEGKLLGALRKEALGQQFREAAALGTAAAAGKGLEIRGKALREYAAAIEGSTLAEPAGKKPEPPLQKEADYGKDNGDSRGGTDTSSGNGGQASDRRDKSGNNSSRRRAEDPEVLCRRVTAVLEEKPLLDFINRIPGKNGRRWAVFPFSFACGGVEFSVTLRLLLNTDPLASVISESTGFERLAADIKVSSGSPDREHRWCIVLERSEKAQTRVELSLFVGEKPHDFPPAEQKRLETELADALGLSRDRVIIRKEALRFADSRDDLLRPVDEAV